MYTTNMSRIYTSNGKIWTVLFRIVDICSVLLLNVTFWRMPTQFHSNSFFFKRVNVPVSPGQFTGNETFSDTSRKNCECSDNSGSSCSDWVSILCIQPISTQRLTSWISCQDPSRIPQDSWIFLPEILPGFCKIMEGYPGKTGFLPGNSGIQET